MQDAFGFADLLFLLAPLLAVLWLWGLGRVLRDLRRIGRASDGLAQ